jgi:hypothetical protein
VLVENLLQRHLAMQLGVKRDEDGAQTTAGVRPEDTEPLAVAGGRAHGIRGGAVGVGLAILLGRSGSDMTQGALDVGVAELSQALSSRTADRDGRQTLLDVTVLRDVEVRHSLDDGPLRTGQMTEGDEMFGKGADLVEGPGLEGGHELGLVDQPVLQGEQSEQKVAVGGDGGHGASLPGLRYSSRASGPRPQGPSTGRAG